MIELGIQFQECNNCKAMIYPHPLISTKGEKIKIEKYILPKSASSMTDGKLIHAKNIEINIKEVDYKNNAKNVIRIETETEVTLEIERHLAILEGNENNGNQKCPICGFVLVSWSSPRIENELKKEGWRRS